MKHRVRYAWLLGVILAVTACTHTDGELAQQRSVYYWSTVFNLDSTQQAFIRDNGVDRIYLRYFDVVVDEKGEVMPNATVAFAAPQPDSIEIVPTVFIVNDCMTKDMPNLDQLLLKRILQMNETHDIAGVKEIQIDCDWTRRTEKAYFEMLRRLRAAAKEKGITISATIRLHQLSSTPPPVDKGVLMMYNTGDVTNFERNPILDMEDAAPYLKHLSRYSLPLSTAYPIFSWDILFRAGRYVGIMHSDDELPILPGDTIVHREVPVETVLQARHAIDVAKPEANYEIILFDISKRNMSNLQDKQYEKIYRQ